MSPKKGGQPERKQSWVTPDLARCRARSFGASDIVFCLEEDPRHCAYAVSYGCSYFCLHLKRLEIAARTKAA